MITVNDLYLSDEFKVWFFNHIGYSHVQHNKTNEYKTKVYNSLKTTDIFWNIIFFILYKYYSLTSDSQRMQITISNQVFALLSQDYNYDYKEIIYFPVDYLIKIIGKYILLYE